MRGVVNSEQSLQSAIGHMRELFRTRRYFTFTTKEGKGRTQDQNAIAHAWYGQVARELREDDELGVKSFCKLHFGVPILRASDDDFREEYDKTVKPMPYETKLALMKWFPVTSLMTTPQTSAYLEDVRNHYMARGVILEFPEK